MRDRQNLVAAFENERPHQEEEVRPADDPYREQKSAADREDPDKFFLS